MVGSGPGGLQTSYSLTRLGVKHALISADGAPGGMFQRLPIFQRLISWTKPFAPAQPGTRAYEWYDWNSLLGEEPSQSALVRQFMDRSYYFPSRAEMEMGLAAFAEQTGIQVRYGCMWESTRLVDGGFVLGTSDGEYSCNVVVFAIGATTPWKPPTPGMDEVPHYTEAKPLRQYEDKQVFVIGKRNSAFEVADALLPVARRIYLGSPRPARISVVEHAAIGARARYLQPYEDHVFGGGNLILDVAIDRIERLASGYRVHATGTTRPGSLTFSVDDVVAATGFATPLGDLTKLGVPTLNQGRFPAITPFWESASVPGIYFAGSITQASPGLNKYGLSSNSAAVQGFRYNARVMAEHIALKHFGLQPKHRLIEPAGLVPYLLAEATRAPELWNQRSYLARVVSLGPEGIFDRGIQPLADFVDSAGEDAVAIAVETDSSGDIHPAVYIRHMSRVDEHLMSSNPLLQFDTVDHQRQLEGLLKGYIGR
ncbi:MAG TPA: NAD(P)-binding domain-containing protein [Actinomycetota bacterium]|nr:NAD(P)-binding domain-containing protein [Actinomycetota bacterium]